MHQFIEKQEAINNQTVQTLNDLKDTFAKFISALAIQEKGKFLAQPQPTPKIFKTPKVHLVINTWTKSSQSSLFVVVKSSNDLLLILVKLR